MPDRIKTPSSWRVLAPLSRKAMQGKSGMVFLVRQSDGNEIVIEAKQLTVNLGKARGYLYCFHGANGTTLELAASKVTSLRMVDRWPRNPAEQARPEEASVSWPVMRSG